MKTETPSYVSVLRMAHPDTPSMREIARQIGCSASAVSLFELGRQALSPDRLKAYAEAIERSAEEVRHRWAMQAAAFHSARAAELREEIAKHKVGKGQLKQRRRPRK